MQAALADWRGGRTPWQVWDEGVERSRTAFAAMVGTTPARVAIGATVSGLVGLVAGSLPRGTRVVIPDVEFTSTLFPFLVRPELDVRTVAPADLPHAIDDHTGVAAFSAVQMTSGEVADLEAIASAAGAHDVLTVVDATQAAGWLPLDAARFGVVVAAAYKWLMCPRGTGFIVVAPDRLEAILPAAAGWYAGEDPYESYAGPPLRLAADARRLDTSPAWFSWAGAAPTLELINEIGVEAIHAHDVALANRFRAGIGLPPGDSAIVVSEHPRGAERLLAEGIPAAEVLGRLRVGFHLYNTTEDVDRVVDALGSC